jgi:hypothetical protein
MGLGPIVGLIAPQTGSVRVIGDLLIAIYLTGAVVTGALTAILCRMDAQPPFGPKTRADERASLASTVVGMAGLWPVAVPTLLWFEFGARRKVGMPSAPDAPASR